jgi:hypothetical protein
VALLLVVQNKLYGTAAVPQKFKILSEPEKFPKFSSFYQFEFL